MTSFAERPVAEGATRRTVVWWQDVTDAAPTVVFRDDELSTLSLRQRSVVYLSSEARRVPAWVVPLSSLASADPAPPGDLWASKLTLRHLGISARSAEVGVVVPNAVDVALARAIARDLPPPGYVDGNVELLGLDATRWMLVTSGSAVAAVRLRHRSSARARQLRVPRTMRVMLGDPQSVSIAELDVAAFEAFDVSDIELRPRARLRTRLRARTRHRAELGLAALFGAPEVALKGVPAVAGDDANRVVRMAPNVFPVLGMSPGDQAVVSWADRSVVAVALATADDAGASAGGGAAQLTLNVDARLRAELGVPRQAVLVVRRRVWTLLVGQLNQLVLPLGGLLFAALAVPDFPWWAVAASVAVILFFTLVPPLRHKRPPYGASRR